MSEDVDLGLMRRLHGEASPGEAESTRRLLADDPAVAARFAELERLWEGLELAPPAAADGRLLAAVRRRLLLDSSRAESDIVGSVGLWGLSPALGRAAAAAILAAGIGLGAWVGEGVTTEEDRPLSFEPSMAESYWSAVDDADTATVRGGER